MCLLNVQGLVGKTYNKLQSEELSHLFNTNDILLFTETWSNFYYDYSVSGFTHHVLNRQLMNKRAVRNSGRLIIYIADKLTSKDTQ